MSSPKLSTIWFVNRSLCPVIAGDRGHATCHLELQENGLANTKVANQLCEIGDTMYDSVAFYKHRSEGETNSTFAYMPPDLRVQAFRQCREVLWALDAAW